MSNVVIILVVLLIVLSVPNWGWSRDWGHGPWAVLAGVLVVLLLLRLLGVI